MLVLITNGNFGAKNSKGFVNVVRPGEVVEVADATGRRLIRLGMAQEAFLDMPAEAEESMETAEPKSEAVTEIDENGLEYSPDMTRNELERVGEELGIDPEELKKARNKAALIELLDEYTAECEEEMPSFDAAAAVL